MRLDCSDPVAAGRLLEAVRDSYRRYPRRAEADRDASVGASRETVAEVNRRLVEGGISVYGLQEVHATLEDWFLSVTSRLGEQS